MLLLYHVGNTFSTYEVHKGFIIVNDYSDQNCDAFFKIKKDKTVPCLAYTVRAVALPLKVQKRNKAIYRNTNGDGKERI